MLAMASFRNIKEEPYVTLPREEESVNVSKISFMKLVVASFLVAFVTTGAALTTYFVMYKKGSGESGKTVKGKFISDFIDAI